MPQENVLTQLTEAEIGALCIIGLCFIVFIIALIFKSKLDKK